MEVVLIWANMKQRLCYVNKTQLQNNETKKTIQQVKFSVQSGSTAVDTFPAPHSDMFICCFRESWPPTDMSVRKVVTVCHIRVKHDRSVFYPELCVLLMFFFFFTKEEGT